MPRQQNLFETQRSTEKQAINLTIDTLRKHAQQYDIWQISFSGGKDSTALTTLVLHLIETGEIEPPKHLEVCYADTRMELPPLQASAMSILREVERRGFNSQVVMADLDKRFLVYILGRGVPPPNNSTLRYCTQQTKLNPMKRAMEKLYAKSGGAKILSFNGVRIGESAIRDRRIQQQMALSCSRNGSECGQGYFQRDLDEKICDKLSPILHWRVCHIWDWLMLDAPNFKFNTELLATVYGGDEAIEKNARTGCICCPLASKDLALESLSQMSEWSYLKPLLEMRSLYQWARKFENRLQKVGERKKDGSFTKSPNRKGPLKLEARTSMLEKILDIQGRINQVAELEGKLLVDLINEEEEARIRELIAAKTFPNGWDGTEPGGEEITPQYYSSGACQMPLFDSIDQK